MKGISNAVLVVALLVVMIVGILSAFAVYLAIKPVAIPTVTYDGEFDDAFLATKAWFYSDFTEGVDCNITSDVLGGSGYTACIYDTATAWNATLSSAVNSKDWEFDLVLDIDGPVKSMEFDCNLQNTGTGQAADDAIISTAELWTYEDEPTKVEDLTIDDQTAIDHQTAPLAAGEYVMHVVLHSKTISPDFADGDDVLRCEVDLDTEGDVDAARITVEE